MAGINKSIILAGVGALGLGVYLYMRNDGSASSGLTPQQQTVVDQLQVLKNLWGQRYRENVAAGLDPLQDRMLLLDAEEGYHQQAYRVRSKAVAEGLGTFVWVPEVQYNMLLMNGRLY